MNQNSTTARRAMSAAALLAATGLVLAGCKSSSSASGSGGSPSSGSSASGQAKTSGTAGGSGGTTTATGLAYFPAAAGYTWIYEDHVSTGVDVVTNKVVAVKAVSGGQEVTMASTDDLGGKPTRTKFSYIFNSNGSITVPLTQFGSTLKLISGSIQWPSSADLAAGQANHSTLVFSISEAGKVVHVTAHVTVKGDGTQSVTVPAGTYQAQVIDETMDEKFDGVAIDLTDKTWLANGVGPVKSELLSGGVGSSADTDEVLKSFTK
jgi:hypothetical protein